MYSQSSTFPNFYIFTNNVLLKYHDADKLGLNTLLEPYSDKDSTMEQELANCHAVYDIAIYKKRRACATIKKYTVVTFDQN